MIVDYIVLGVLVASLIALIVIVAKKFPMMAAINTSNLPKHRQDKVKKDLIEDRLKRKLRVFDLRKMFQKSEKNGNTITFVDRFKHAVQNLEQRYKQRIEELQPDDQDDVEKKKQIVLEDAKALFAQDKNKEAEAKFIEVISLDPKNIDAYKGLADVYVARKDYAHARETYQFILKLNASDDSTYEHLGKIATQEGKLEEAERDYMKSLSLNNQVAGYHIDLGDVYTAMGDHQKALTAFEEAIKLEPNNPKYLDSAIQTSIILKNKITAQKYLTKLKEANPENEKLKELSAEIDKL